MYKKIIDRINQEIRILVVDDEESIILTLKRLFKKEPYQIDFYTDAKKALDAIDQFEYSIIISDNHMPQVTGLTLLEKAKTRSPDSRRILLTGMTEPPEAIEAFNLGVIHKFITKPWDNKKLISYLHEALEAFRSKRFQYYNEKVKDITVRKKDEKLNDIQKKLKQTQTQLFLHLDEHELENIEISKYIKDLSFLIIDENKEITNSLATILTKAGAESVMATTSYREAQNYITEAKSIDVVLSEWTFGQHEGLDLLTTIHADQLLENIPIFIFITTEENKQSVEKAIAAKVDGYLIKPFSIKVLLNQLSHIIEKRHKEIDLQQSQRRESQFLIAQSSPGTAQSIQTILNTHGIQKIIHSSTGIACCRMLENKRIDYLFYDEAFNDPGWSTIPSELNKRNITQTNLHLIVTSQSPISNFAIKIYNDSNYTNVPTSFLSQPFTGAGVYAALNMFRKLKNIDSFKYS